MEWISLGGKRAPASPHPALYEGLRPSNSPWRGFLPATGSVVVRSSQGRFCWMLLFLNNNYCWCTSTASLASRLRRMPTSVICLRLAHVKRWGCPRGCLLLWLLFASLLLPGCVLWRLCPPYYQSVCFLLEFTVVIYSVNAPRMQNEQYIHR